MKRCPRCRAVLERVTDGAVIAEFHPGYHVFGTALPTRWEWRPFWSCSGCEYCAIDEKPLPIGKV